jgi:hypothetical protein
MVAPAPLNTEEDTAPLREVGVVLSLQRHREKIQHWAKTGGSGWRLYPLEQPQVLPGLSEVHVPDLDLPTSPHLPARSGCHPLLPLGIEMACYMIPPASQRATWAILKGSW